MERLGAPLLVRVGEAQHVLDRLCRQHNVTRVVSHEETGNGFTYARDRRIAAWARDAGIIWDQLPQSGVIRRLDNRDQWQGRRDAFMAAPPLDAPALRALRGLEPDSITISAPDFQSVDNIVGFPETFARSNPS